MTDNEIIKALECCKDPMASCDECFLVNADRSCERTLMGTALDLINRQKAEIENHNVEVNKMVAEIERLKESRDRWKRNAQGFDEASRETERMIERLTMLVDESESNNRTALKIINSYENDIKTAKAEAIKEFAERLKEKSEYIDTDEFWCDLVTTEDIDNLVKEMVGDTE